MAQKYLIVYYHKRLIKQKYLIVYYHKHLIKQKYLIVYYHKRLIKQKYLIVYYHKCLIKQKSMLLNINVYNWQLPICRFRMFAATIQSNADFLKFDIQVKCQELFTNMKKNNIGQCARFWDTCISVF